MRIAKKRGQRKPLLIVMGKPLLIHTLLALEASGHIDEIIVAVHKNDIRKWNTAIKKFKLKRIKGVIAGGKTRFESVKRSLSFLNDGSGVIVIHDGVRPFVNKKMISDSIEACKVSGAAIVGVPAISTVKSVDRALWVKGTPDRRRLYVTQTPQVFKREVILKAYNTRYTPDVTDDSMLVERLGYKIKMVLGSYENIKVTTPEDLILVEAILKKRKT